MTIKLNNIGKRFRYRWIIKGITQNLEPDTSYAVTGSNGSGKSTFLKLLSGHLSPSEGSIEYMPSNQKLSLKPDKIYKEVSFAAPYIDLIESFSLEEMIHFHFSFKNSRKKLTVKELLKIGQIPANSSALVKDFSSGMKQRLKLLLAICSDTKILLLDEPSTNLDQNGVIWYHHLLEEFKKDRLVVVASNIEEDYQFCNHFIDIEKFKSDL